MGCGGDCEDRPFVGVGKNSDGPVVERLDEENVLLMGTAVDTEVANFWALSTTRSSTCDSPSKPFSTLPQMDFKVVVAAEFFLLVCVGRPL